MGATRHVDVAGRVHGNPGSIVKVTAPQVGGVEEGGAGGVQLRHEGVGKADQTVPEGACGCREVRRISVTCHVGIASRVNGDAATPVAVTPAEVGGVGEDRINAEWLLG